MSPKDRRKSIDSSDSSSSSDSSDSHHKLKPKKEKKDKADKKHGGSKQKTHQMPFMPSFNSHDTPQLPQGASTEHGSFQASSQPPPAYSATPPPSSGYRIPLTAAATLPPPDQMGQPPCVDADGRSPVFIGSALMDRSVHPCKIGPHLRPICQVAYGGGERAHNGRFDLLPFDSRTMEFVPTSDGKIPGGRRPIEGGYEENGAKLYHAIGVVNGVRIPGKTGEHLRGCNVGYGGGEHTVTKYDLLCWR